MGEWPPLSGWTATTEKRLDQRRLADTLETIAPRRCKGALRRRRRRAPSRRTCARKAAASRSRTSPPTARNAPSRSRSRYHGGRIYRRARHDRRAVIAACLRICKQLAKPGYADYARALDAAWRERFAERRRSRGCTTHFSVVDRAGNFCAVTQTLLSIFGSRVVSPSTGVLLNNGIMWFDPEPGKAELARARQALPRQLLPGGRRDAERRALRPRRRRRPQDRRRGAADRSFLIDHGTTLEDAFHRPRIDMSGGDARGRRPALPAHELPRAGSGFSGRDGAAQRLSRTPSRGRAACCARAR